MSPNILRAEIHGYLNDNTRKMQALKISNLPDKECHCEFILLKKEEKYQRINRMTHRASLHDSPHLFFRQSRLDIQHEKKKPLPFKK